MCRNCQDRLQSAPAERFLQSAKDSTRMPVIWQRTRMSSSRSQSLLRRSRQARRSEQRRLDSVRTLSLAQPLRFSSWSPARGNRTVTCVWDAHPDTSLLAQMFLQPLDLAKILTGVVAVCMKRR